MKVKEEPVSPRSSPDTTTNRSSSRKRPKYKGSHSSESPRYRKHGENVKRARHERLLNRKREHVLATKIKKEDLSDGEYEEPARLRWGPSDINPNYIKSEEKPKRKERPNLGLSGALTKETNMYRGVLINYSEPPEAKVPKKRWRVYPFKGTEEFKPLYLHRQSAYLIGRDRHICDMPLLHPSISKQHAVLQYRSVAYTKPDGTASRAIRPYIIDLNSPNGTYLNGSKIEPQRYLELREKDVLKFAFSSREYVLLHDKSKDDDSD